jgi:hypothetical protein
MMKLKIWSAAVAWLGVLGVSSFADDAAVLQLFDEHCASCHDERLVLNGSINLTALRSKDDQVKAILDRVSRPDVAKGRMPKSKGKPGDSGYVPPLSASEIDVLKAWAEGRSEGDLAAEKPAPQAPQATAPAKPQTASRAFVPLREELLAIAKDVAGLDRALQPMVRYVTLTNLANLRDAAGNPVENDGQLDIYRAAVSKLLNSVSRAGRIVVPKAVDAARTIYRIDLRDYGWDAKEWEPYVVRGYPYALRGVDGRAERDIQEATGSESAWVRADWFVFAASQPPLYHDLLRLPGSERDLERQIGVDTQANLRSGRAVRAGFRESGVSQGNRLVERHEAGTGMYWKSYDFTPLERNGGHDLFRSPLGPVGAGLTPNKDREFQHDGGEMIFTLPNGLHAYFLAKANGERIDRGPTDIVQDARRRDGVIINGISCMSCHSDGMKYWRDESLAKFVDQVGPTALKAGLDRRDAHAVEDLYAAPEKLQAVVKGDEDRYKAVLEQALPGYQHAFDPVSKLYNRFRQELRLETFASEFGEEDGTVLRRLKESRDPDLEVLAAQVEGGLGFPRASWLDQFERIAKALGHQLRAFHPIAYAEFTKESGKAGGHQGQTVLAEGGKLTISTDKAHYVKGDLLSVKIRSTEAVYVRIYHLSADHKVTQIFPNAARSDNFIRGGETVTLPGPKDAFRFRMKEPFGTEILLAVASPVQFSDAENLSFSGKETFKSFGEADLSRSLSRGTKGLELEVTNRDGKVVAVRPAPTFQARAVYTVSER